MNTTKTATTDRMLAAQVESLAPGGAETGAHRSQGRAPEDGSGRSDQRGRGLLGDEYVDGLIAQADADGLALTGKDGFLTEPIGRVLERGLQTELADHLGYDKGDPAGTFEPRLVPKGARRVGGLDEQIISVYAGGMTVRDIQARPHRHRGRYRRDQARAGHLGPLQRGREVLGERVLPAGQPRRQGHPDRLL